MAVNLREQSEKELENSLEGAWALPVVLIGPDGEIYNTSQNSGEPLSGQVLYDSLRDNLQTGAPMTVNKPVVTLRRSSLLRIPKASEKWIVQIPVDPSRIAELENFELDKNQPVEGGRSIGFIRLYLKRVKQS